ncbi:hypothetical protein PJV95_06475 [Aliarcobacter butzleri]|jgi:hypothetical protein|uniref:hypothetical protein n=1 Tax=Aliarcobacter butzleri TaxID=28197 RepID=UPI00125F556A|nr:hypothetical protein [Aliarcobacter butzleri]MDN5125879.1 hypothetical protein [Aliarcobacter butzleri]
MKKISQKTLQELFGFKSRNTLSEWNKSDQRIILKLIEKYFTEDDIKEFIDKERISKLEFYDECIELYTLIYRDVFERCKEIKKRDYESINIFGRFLEKMENTRLEKTLVSLEDFLNREQEIYLYYQKEFTIYLLEDEKYENYLEHINFIKNFYDSFPSNIYKFFFIRNSMWILTPSPSQKSHSDSIKLYNHLPDFVKRMPFMKQIISIAGIVGLAGIIDKKYFEKEEINQ